MRVQSIELRRLRLPMREPFEASYGVERDKDVILVTVQTAAGALGYGECVAMSSPHYTEETAHTAWWMLIDFLAPQLKALQVTTTADLFTIRDRFAPIRGNRMAKAALEMAVWDAFANETQQPLARLLGQARAEIDVGISIGIQPDIPHLLRKVEGYLAQGFRRIKMKVRPGFDLDAVRAVRKAFGDVPLMIDANSAYTIADTEHLQRFDEFGLLMMEQPLGWDDIVDHAALQRRIATPICLDESIRSVDDVRRAVELGACRVVNLKPGRVGGFAESIEIHAYCQRHGIDLWCGGMLETGIGRLHNIALTSLPGFTLPGDTAPSARYFAEDVIDPPVEFSQPGMLAVEPLPGVASRVRERRLDKWVVEATRL